MVSTFLARTLLLGYGWESGSFSKLGGLGGYHFGGSHNKDHHIWGFILGTPNFGKLPFLAWSILILHPKPLRECWLSPAPKVRPPVLKSHDRHRVLLLGAGIIEASLLLANTIPSLFLRPHKRTLYFPVYYVAPRNPCIRARSCTLLSMAVPEECCGFQSSVLCFWVVSCAEGWA